MMRTDGPAPGEPRRTVLVVDDEAAVVALVRTMLWRAGYNVIEAANGEEALNVAARETGPIDVLLTDVVMPVMNGYELADKMRRARPEVKVLYMSGYRDRVIFESTGVEGGDAPLIRKPFTQHSLVSAISERVADAGAPMAEIEPSTGRDPR
jgi:CheY-like chemotaxis protein